MQTPSAGDVRKSYPASAQHAGISGRVLLECRIDDEGRLRSCLVVYETPTGQQFGEASLRMSAKFRMRAEDGEARPVMGRTIRIPIVWRPER